MRSLWLCIALSACAGGRIEQAFDDAAATDSTLRDTGLVGEGGPLFETDLDDILPPDTKATPDSACAALGVARCAVMEACTPFTVRQFHDTVESCRTAFKRRCLFALSAPGASSSAESVSSCAKVLATTACEAYVVSDPPACFPEPGTLANGAGCWDDSQCASGICLHGLFAYCGKCQPGVGLGGSCATSPCVAGLSCADGTCVKLGSIGAACASDAACAVTLACRAGKCAANALGDPCDSATNAGCRILAGLRCMASKCVAATSSETGGPCASFFDCRAGDCVASSCKPTVIEGGACGPGLPGCRSPFVCAGGKCAPPSATTCP